MAGLGESLNSQGNAKRREDCCAMARQNVEQKGYGIAGTGNAKAGLGTDPHRLAMEWNRQKSLATAWRGAANLGNGIEQRGNGLNG